MELRVSWCDVHYSVGDKEILRGLTGAATPGRALAILGSSGAGKTTLLNAISGRLETNSFKVLKGKIRLGRAEFSNRYRALMGYVTQDDVVGAYETPATAIYFSLRTRCGVDSETAEERVEEMLKDLNLVASRDTIVGVPGLVAGLSGGERKRVNIGMELIANTKILLLDEPTSGLDSVTSEHIIEVLRDIARRGYTVIYTVHQPTARAFALFDDLLLMAMGRAVYHGPAEAAKDYFQTVGYTCPRHYTPTDYFMQLLQNGEVAPQLVDLWAPPTPYGDPILSAAAKEDDAYAVLDSLVQDRDVKWTIQALELLKRAFRQVLLNRVGIAIVFVQSIFFSLLAGLLFLNLRPTVTGVQDTLGALFMVVTNRAFGGVMGTVTTFTSQKALFIREQQSASYSPAWFLLTKLLAEFPLHLAAEVVSSVMVFFMLGLEKGGRDGGGFWVFLGAMVVLGVVARSFGLLVSAASPNVEVGSALAPAVVVPLMLAGGLFATTGRLRPYWVWLEKPSFIRHGFVILTHNQFTRIDRIACDAERFGAAFCNATYPSGGGVLRALQLDDPQDEPFAMWISLATLFGIATMFSVVALMCVARTKF